MKSNRWMVLVAIGAGGLAATGLLALAAGLSATDAASLVAYAVGGAAVAGVLSTGLLGLLRRSSIVLLAVVTGLAPVLAVGIGVAFASSAMFISSHDLHALFVVLVAAGTVGVMIALVLGRRVAEAGRSLGAMARRLGDEGPGARLSLRGQNAKSVSPAELASLGAELELTATRLAEAQHQATAVERSRRELVAWVSHDLRTPLAGIRAMVEALEDRVVDDPATVARYHRAMRQEADRLAGLVDDLFELSRIQAGALALDLERVPLDELVSDVLASASMAAGAKGIDLRGGVSEPSPIVELSTPEMARVVRNLLDNAIRHTRPGGTVWIHARLDETGYGAEVSVLDGCGGIPERDLDHVFDLAYRGDAARTPGSGGAGLGLAVARGLVEAHHGEISVCNEGVGCRFTVRLPLSVAAPRPTG
jgi:signal transduction histidine kinase